MDKDRLYYILDYNKAHINEIQSACQKFYLHIGRQTAAVITDIQMVAEMILNNMNYQFLRIPLKSKEIGAFQLRLNDASYLVLNTSKSLANNNFALVHELYHILIQKDSGGNSADIYLNHYDEDENEMMANAFAGFVLMPAEDFQLMSGLIKSKEINSEILKNTRYIRELSMIYTFMNYYKTTYMSVVIRCYELNVFDIKNTELLDFLLKNNSESAQRVLCKIQAEIKGTVSIMEPTLIDDFSDLYLKAKGIGERYVQMGAITEEDLQYRLDGMKKAYDAIKGEISCQ